MIMVEYKRILFFRKSSWIKERMMRVIVFLHIVIGVILLVIMNMLTSVVDLIYKVDEVGMQIGHQRSQIVFLESVVNELTENCNITVADFENYIHTHYGKKVQWREKDNFVSIGIISVTKKDSCIEKMSFNWMF